MVQLQLQHWVNQARWIEKGLGKGSSTWFPIKPGIDLSTVLLSYSKGSDFRHPFKGMPFQISNLVHWPSLLKEVFTNLAASIAVAE